MSLLPASTGSLVAASSEWHWHYYYLIFPLVVWQAVAILWRFWWKAPSNVIIAAYRTPLGRWLTALQMYLDAENVIQNAYDMCNGKPFAVPMMDRWIVFVTDRNQLQQLDSAPDSVLSIGQALRDLAFVELIMGHLQVPHETQGPNSEPFRVNVGVLKNKLRSKVPAMNMALKARVRDAVALEVAPRSVDSRHDSMSWEQIRLFPALLRIFTRVNLLIFLGEELSGREEVYRVVMGFFGGCMAGFPILSLTPNLLLPLVGPLAMGWGKARQRLFSLLHWLARKCLEDEITGDKSNEPEHVVQWTTEMTKTKDAVAIAKMTLGLLFASAFQVPMIALFCVYRICKHPEYHDKLQSEAVECKDLQFSSLNHEMPYLDSFIKETSRLSPGPIFSNPRTAMVDYISSDGCRVPSGNWFAVPQLSLMRDESIWPHALEFDGFRFVDEMTGTSKSRFTHPSHEFPFWGGMKHTCPARFYVSVIMKMILTHLIVDYEIKLADPMARPFFSFGKMRLPSPFISLLIRKRTVAGLKPSSETTHF